MDPLAFFELIRQISEEIGTKVKTLNCLPDEDDQFTGETVDGATFEGTITDQGESLSVNVEYLGQQYNWTIEPKANP